VGDLVAVDLSCDSEKSEGRDRGDGDAEQDKRQRHFIGELLCAEHHVRGEELAIADMKKSNGSTRNPNAITRNGGADPRKERALVRCVISVTLIMDAAPALTLRSNDDAEGASAPGQQQIDHLAIDRIENRHSGREWFLAREASPTRDCAARLARKVRQRKTRDVADEHRAVAYRARRAILSGILRHPSVHASLASTSRRPATRKR
jgi:hypothetical protein